MPNKIMRDEYDFSKAELNPYVTDDAIQHPVESPSLCCEISALPCVAVGFPVRGGLRTTIDRKPIQRGGCLSVTPEARSIDVWGDETPQHFV